MEGPDNEDVYFTIATTLDDALLISEKLQSIDVFCEITVINTNQPSLNMYNQGFLFLPKKEGN